MLSFLILQPSTKEFFWGHVEKDERELRSLQSIRERGGYRRPPQAREQGCQKKKKKNKGVKRRRYLRLHKKGGFQRASSELGDF